MAKSKNEQISREGDVVVQLATRVPKTLYREVKLHCVEESISISELVAEALKDILAKHGVKGERTRAPKAGKRRSKKERERDDEAA
jgi:hypothetical protein